jgi:O-antigen ligase
MTIVSLFAELNSVENLTPYLTVLIFLININILMLAINKRSTQAFLSLFFKTTSLMAFLHILLVFFDIIGSHYGRSLFFGDTQPNLGGEIYVVAVVSGAIAMHRTTFLLYMMPMLISAYFLQSRTSLLVVVAITLIKLTIERGYSISLRSLWFGGALLTLASFSLLVSESSRKWLLENVLFADDQFRGASSGFLSGRDARWQDAWNSFIDRPFFGHGLNWYIDGMSLGAHSPFLYSLVYFGIFGLTFWIFFLVRFFVIAKYNLHIAVLLLPCFLMFVLNDRFLNSNAFPLLLYFIVIRLSQFRSKFTLQLHQSLGSRPHTRANLWRISQ